MHGWITHVSGQFLAEKLRHGNTASNLTCTVQTFTVNNAVTIQGMEGFATRCNTSNKRRDNSKWPRGPPPTRTTHSPLCTPRSRATVSIAVWRRGARATGGGQYWASARSRWIWAWSPRPSWTRAWVLGCVW
ncbi:hypothetical protein SCLCIDRAFT_921009 [Scleroderma citrinum Foug A]|uniref:Uncharacterized protein n=1 Tax=Scleroderma citrinum Foug A TaxID=1036808 RepID=A0A0C3DYT2_9AGAM|nr:hypothetical protein SCLCIDRAFT_921009 [Scleroderma citrinum Foug A]